MKGSSYADISLKIVVCGEETNTLKLTTTPIIVNELKSSHTSPYTSDIGTTYFLIDTTASDSTCGELTYGLYLDSQGSTPATANHDGVSLNINGATKQIQI